MENDAKTLSFEKRAGVRERFTDCFAALAMTKKHCHCEERSDEAVYDCFLSLRATRGNYD